MSPKEELYHKLKETMRYYVEYLFECASKDTQEAVVVLLENSVGDECVQLWDDANATYYIIKDMDDRMAAMNYENT